MNNNGSRSPVPAIPLRRGESTVREIAALRRRADDEGRGTLAYLLECAEQVRRDRAERETDPRDLYRPAEPRSV
jgi:hypothetical protein